MTAALAALCAGAAVMLWWPPAGGLSGIVEHQSRARNAGPAESILALDEIHLPRRQSARAADAGEDPELTVNGSDNTVEAVAIGNVVGFVYDDEGETVANKEVVLTLSSRPSFASRRMRSVSDSEGEYLIKNVPVGPWKVWSSTPVRPPNEVLAPAGELDVYEGVNYYDIVVSGRKLSGRFTLTHKGLDGLTLQLELRDRRAPNGEVLASARLWNSESPPWKSPDQDLSRPMPLSAQSESGNGEEPPEESGVFEFVGLEPRDYILRLSPSASASSSGSELDLYIEQNVDLIESDVELQPREFTLDEFIENALRRRRSED